jgi:heme A synthase
LKGYPWWFSKILIVVIFAVVTITGFGLVPHFLNLRFELEPVWETTFVFRRMLLLVHVLGGLICVLVLGALLPIHIRINLRQNLKKRSGVWLVGIMVFLSLTGFGVQYGADEDLLKFLGAGHLAAGALLAATILLHLFGSGKRAEP